MIQMASQAEVRVLEAGVQPRLVIAEDFVLIQENIRRVVQPHCEVVAAVEDGDAALEAVATYSPDILLVDVSLPGKNGFEVAEELMHSHPAVSIIFVTAYGDKAYVQRAFEIGAKGYILKGSMWSELPAAIQAVAAGGSYRSHLLA